MQTCRDQALGHLRLAGDCKGCGEGVWPGSAVDDCCRLRSTDIRLPIFGDLVVDWDDDCTMIRGFGMSWTLSRLHMMRWWLLLAIPSWEESRGSRNPFVNHLSCATVSSSGSCFRAISVHDKSSRREGWCCWWSLWVVKLLYEILWRFNERHFTFASVEDCSFVELNFAMELAVRPILRLVFLWLLLMG